MCIFAPKLDVITIDTTVKMHGQLVTRSSRHTVISSHGQLVTQQHCEAKFYQKGKLPVVNFIRVLRYSQLVTRSTRHTQKIA